MDPKWDWPLIAIVDDDEFVCRAIKRLLSLHGMDATIFSSGRTFVDLLDVNLSFVPDCVILDVQMPDLNGLGVQKLLASKRPVLRLFLLPLKRTRIRSPRRLWPGRKLSSRNHSMGI